MKLLLPIVFITAISACKISTESAVRSESGEFSKQDSDVDLIPSILKENGIELTSLSRMEDNLPSQSSISFQNALVSSWLASLSYGSASQIASQLQSAGILDENAAKATIATSNQIQLFRALSDSYEGNGEHSIGAYMKQSTVMKRLEVGIKALPALYKLASKDLQDSGFESLLLAEWDTPREGREVNRIGALEGGMYLDFLKSQDPESFVKQEKRWVSSSERLDLVFKGITAALIKSGKNAVGSHFSNTDLDSFIKKLKDQLSDDNLGAGRSFNRIAELMEYNLAYNDREENSGSPDKDGVITSPSKLLLFSGGRLKFSQTDIFQEGSTQLLIIEHRNNRDVFFVFRGTKGQKDLLVDLHPNLIRDPIDGVGQVHAGFVKAFQELTLPATPVHLDLPVVLPEGKTEEQLRKEMELTEKKYSQFRPILANVLKRAQLQKKRIWIAGHSLGGAMGLMFFKKLLTLPEYSGLAAGAYTIGAPRIGNGAFAGNFDRKISSMFFRVVRIQ